MAFSAAWHAVNPRNLGGQLVPWGSRVNSGEVNRAVLESFDYGPRYLDKGVRVLL